VPKRVFFTGELPRNTMGKVQKNLLRDQYKDDRARGGARTRFPPRRKTGRGG
jgi:acyl-CoA synthetase (AMP-forming)/AMP-acid ligase II